MSDLAIAHLPYFHFSISLSNSILDHTTLHDPDPKQPHPPTIEMRFLTLLSIIAALSLAVALPWDGPWEKGCCDSYSPGLRKCFRWVKGCEGGYDGSY